ncbi:MAG: hypothetical protein MJH09_12755 [Cetobacterium sp.]|nr:hypothetical protein [Cetobacterium sp.]
MTFLPTLKPKEIFIYGEVIDKELLEHCKSKIDIKKNSIYILGIYPSNFPKQEIVIEDFKQKIDWNKIPLKHNHINTYKNNRTVLCTHHPNGEINELLTEKRSIAVIYSAWRLFIQYKKYLKSGVWTLNDLPHGLDAVKLLKKENKFYKK